MPPVRTFPAAKPLKTERTHEENQERAYIAASRRSDRSLEARVESARRASEIHKRRTGRSLRVTEQDVVNEEMYEEEDDDLPMQYRRLTAHLQTTNADFDRRLAAYLTNHVAMRTALGAAVANNYANPQYTNAPQFANQMSQMSPHNPTNSMLPPQMAQQSPFAFFQASYPMPTQQTYHGNSNAHTRAASIATPQELHAQTFPSPQSPNDTFKSEDRRMSLPTQGVSPTTPPHTQRPHLVSRTSSSHSLANLKYEAAQQGLVDSTGQHAPNKQDQAFPSQSQQKVSAIANPFPLAFGADASGNNSGMPPFSMTLPMESQQLLGPMLDSNDPFHAMLLGKHEYQPQQSFYNYNPNGPSKGKGFNAMDGMNQTLAPGVLDATFPGHGSYSTHTSAPDSTVTSQGGFFSFDNSYSDMFKTSTSGLTTPGEHDWASLINANVWEEPSQPTVA